MATIVHFEIPADEPERAIKFYKELFDWKIEKYPSGEMDYWMINTKDEKGEKGVDGGLMKRQDPQQQITNFIDVPSIEEYSKKVERLGGMIVVQKRAVPKFGYFAVCLDTEKNAFSLWENDPEAK